MKKACIALTVIFLLSALLTVCLGAAIGTRELRDIIDGNSRLSGLLQSLGDYAKHSPHQEGSFLGETRTDLSCDPGKPVFIQFNLADVRILPAKEEGAYMQIRYYGTDEGRDLSSIPYAEQREDGFHLGTRLEGRSHLISMDVDLYLPAAKLASLQVKIGVGDLTVTHMQFGSFDASVTTGELVFRDSSADTAALSTETGDLIWEGSSEAARSLTMKSGVGDIRLAWPADAGFQLEYKTGTGTFHNQFEPEVTEQSKTLAVLAKGTLRFGDASRTLTLAAGVGDITLLSQPAKE